MLKKFVWEDNFTAVMNHSMLPPGEDDKAYLLRLLLEDCALDPRRTAMVGDTGIDIAAGRAVGVVTVGATYGYGSEDELRAAGAERWLTMAELETLK